VEKAGRARGRRKKRGKRAVQIAERVCEESIGSSHISRASHFSSHFFPRPKK
jgi:hypothetical protein